MTFTQKSTAYSPNGTTKVEPGTKLGNCPAICASTSGALSDGNGAILTDGTDIFFEKGKETARRPMLNMLLVLGFDIYRQPPETTIVQLKAEGFDLTKFHEDTWNGEQSVCRRSGQGRFADKTILGGTRAASICASIEPDRRHAKTWNDTRFEDYRTLGKAFIAARVAVYNNEKLVFSEDYSDIKADVKLPPAVFDPNEFNTAHWEK